MNRRQSIAALAAVASGMLHRSVAAVEPAAADRSASASSLRSFARVRGALDESLVIGGLTGVFSAMVADEPSPLFGFVGVTLALYRERADGSFVVATLEQTYYTDLVGDRVLDTWTNPYTRRRVDVPVFRGPVSRFVIRPDLRFETTLAPAVSSFRHGAERVASITGGLAYRETIAVKIAAQGSAAPRFYDEAVLMRADPAPATGPIGADVSFTSLVSWRPWLQMEGTPGHLVGSGGGRKGLRMEELSPLWLAATRGARPELLDPVPLLLPALDG